MCFALDMDTEWDGTIGIRNSITLRKEADWNHVDVVEETVGEGVNVDGRAVCRDKISIVNNLDEFNILYESVGMVDGIVGDGGGF